jgi:integrase/recombinase XerD
MEKYTLGGVTAQIFFDTRRAKRVPKHEDEKDLVLFELRYPVKYRIFFNGRYYFHTSGIDLTEEEWRAMPTTKKRDLIDNRDLIYSGFEKIKGIIKELAKGEGFSPDNFNRRLSRGRKNSILAAFENKIEKLNKSGQIGTASTYQCAINSIRAYDKRDLKFSDITKDWIEGYEDDLLKEVTVNGKTKQKTLTTAKFYLGCLRAIMNDARKEKIINDGQYPFGSGDDKFEIRSASGRKMALTLQQIKTILDYPLQTETEKRSRDLWYFSYLCNGINFNDMLKLKYRDISGGEIHFVRQKTKRTTRKQKEIAATLLPQMEEIINRWGNPLKKPDNYIFPFLSPGLSPIVEKRIIQNVIRLTNKKMAAISKALDFDPISTYTARHSYATVLKRSGASMEYISESLGHTDLKTTENYLANFEQDQRRKEAEKLIPN